MAKILLLLLHHHLLLIPLFKLLTMTTCINTSKFLFVFFAMFFLTSINLSANVAPAEEMICGKLELRI